MVSQVVSRAEVQMVEAQMEDRTLARKVPMAADQEPAAVEVRVEVRVEAQTLVRILTRTLARKVPMAIQVLAAMEMHLATPDLVSKVRLAARVLANKPQMAVQVTAATEVHLAALVLSKVVHQPIQDQAVMKVPLMVRVLTKKARTVVQEVEVHLAARVLALTPTTAEIHLHLVGHLVARSPAQTANPTRALMATAKTLTAETSLVHRTKGKALP
jgi:hypothetical protein